jgi:ABC-type uncharacterized transport system ATPase subunit
VACCSTQTGTGYRYQGQPIRVALNVPKATTAGKKTYGAGKSTTMRVILGLDAPDEGTALVGGRPYRSLERPLTQEAYLQLTADAVDYRAVEAEEVAR